MQFPRTLVEFQDQFPDEEHCWAYLRRTRWPRGFVCPRCGGRGSHFLASRRLEQCRTCRYQGSVGGHRGRAPWPHGRVRSPGRDSRRDDCRTDFLCEGRDCAAGCNGSSRRMGRLSGTHQNGNRPSASQGWIRTTRRGWPTPTMDGLILSSVISRHGCEAPITESIPNIFSAT